VFRTRPIGRDEDEEVNCRDWLEHLYDHLDGQPLPGDCAAHARECPRCAGLLGASRSLLRCLPRLAPSLPAGLAGRITASLRAEARARQQRRWRRYAGVGLAAAAAALLVVVSRPWWPPPAQPAPEGGIVAAPRKPAPVRESVAEVGSAALALTTRTADAAAGQTSVLWPLVSATSPLDKPMGLDLGGDPALEEPLQTPTRPFTEAGAELSAGFQPVTQSARRAVGLFLRDLASPMGAAVEKPS
jgi:hypothetical protein